MDPAHERDATLAALGAAATRLEQSADGRLIPPEGISFGFALRGARDSGGVAALSGGIKKRPDPGARAGPGTFNTDEPVVRIILTAMKFNPVVRSAAVLMFSRRALAVLENDLFLECVYLDPGSENSGISTMDWGIASCCREGVPDVIVRRGADESGSRIIISGEGPADVANNIIICSNRI